MSEKLERSPWIYAVSAIAAVLGLLLINYQSDVFYLIERWNQIKDGEYAHGYLVLIISAYLIFNQRNELSKLTPIPEYRALFFVLAGSLLWLVAVLVNVQTIQAVALLLITLSLVWTVVGNQIIRLLAFPILFLIFAIPAWSPLSPILQNVTADMVFGAIRVLGIPAFRQDNMLVLPAGQLSVEEACSGLRYLLAALTLGVLYAYLYYSNLRARLIIVLVAASSAIVANLLRVFIVVYLAYTSEMQHPLVNDHLALGWYIFGGVVVLLLFYESWWHKKHSLNLPDKVEQTSYTAPLKGMSTYPVILVILSCSFIISVAPYIVNKISERSADEQIVHLLELPVEVDGWQASTVEIDSWEPVYYGAINQKQIYQKSNKNIVLYRGYYLVQKQGEELINDRNRIHNQDIWNTTYSKPKSLNIESQYVLERLLYNNENNKRLVWYWYNVAGVKGINAYEAKILQILGLLTGNRLAYVTAIAVEESDVELAREMLKNFVTHIE